MSDASLMTAIAARTSVEARRKNCSEAPINAAGTEKRRRLSSRTRSFRGGSEARMSNRDVPWGSGVGLLPPFGARTNSSPGNRAVPTMQ